MKRNVHHKPDTRLKTRIDPKVMPGTKQSAEERWALSIPLLNTPGQQYVEGRRIPPGLAQDAEVRFDRNWNGRPAVLAAMRGLHGELCSVHGRYLQRSGDENKMLTIGPGGGILSIGDALESDIIIFVEGLFDALTLSLCGYSSLATVGRVAPWLPAVCKEKIVVLAFDGNHPGDANAHFYEQFLEGAQTYRLNPPGHSKDWNSALLKQGKATVEQWLRINIARLTNAKTLAT
jgi:hypothetical protein